MMRFYNQQHRFYGGVDLHARSLSLCVLDGAGQTVRARTLAKPPAPFGQGGLFPLDLARRGAAVAETKSLVQPALPFDGRCRLA
jgi:hypothetical protein